MGKRVLILEDEADTLEFAELILTDEGFDVYAIDHYEPLEHIMEFAPNLIILDVRLSNGYGHLLCKDLKANPSTAYIPVVLMSGSNNLEAIAQESNADNFLIKPFGVDDLINIVKPYKRGGKTKNAN
jgi:DNA-binding response OmpR family regulator